MRLLDTNVLLYAVSKTPSERAKTEIALALLDAEDIVLPVQALQEFYVQATRSSRAGGLSHDQACALVESWLRFQTVAVSAPLMQNAMATAARWRIAYWDAAIIEAARIVGCRVVLSEDLQHGMDFAGVRVQNPFLT